MTKIVPIKYKRAAVIALITAYPPVRRLYEHLNWHPNDLNAGARIQRRLPAQFALSYAREAKRG